MKAELTEFLDWAKEYTKNKLDYSSSYLAGKYIEDKGEISNYISIDNQVFILKETLKEMMITFDSEEDRIDFILDICNGYKKRISKL